MSKIVWVDVETTGLNPNTDHILEMGLRITTPDLKLLGEISCVINNECYFEVPSWVDQFVVDMHLKSGLWEAVFQSPIGYSGAELHISEWLKEYEAVGFPMAGSTIGFDRAFIKHWLPDIEALFHYRNIDVSTIKNLWNLWVPEEQRAIAETEKKPDCKTHRVLDDIQDSINELQFYRDRFFV